MLTNAFNTATAGLQTLQVAIGTVSQNVANSGVAGYTRRVVSTESAGPGNSGVAVARIDRTFDEMALKQMRLESAHAAYASAKADILAQIDNAIQYHDDVEPRMDDDAELDDDDAGGDDSGSGGLAHHV